MNPAVRRGEMVLLMNDGCSSIQLIVMKVFTIRENYSNDGQ